MRLAPFLLAFTAILACASTPPPEAREAIDWSAVADEGTPTIVTRDPDGEPRETPIWFVVLEKRAYIRTGGTRCFLALDLVEVVWIVQSECQMKSAVRIQRFDLISTFRHLPITLP